MVFGDVRVQVADISDHVTLQGNTSPLETNGTHLHNILLFTTQESYRMVGTFVSETQVGDVGTEGEEGKGKSSAFEVWVVDAGFEE